MERPNRVFLLGFDGVTLDLIRPWAAQGLLPHFQSLLSSGAAGLLRSTIHPVTPVAWTSLVTGTNAGKHGIFGFDERVPGSYDVRLVDSRARMMPALWEILSQRGRNVGVVNVPLSFPPDQVNGYMVTGMDTPCLEEGVWPEELIPHVMERFPDYLIDAMSFWYNDTDTFLERCHAMEEGRWQLIEHLYQRHRPDFSMAVFVETDRVQHALWGQMTPPWDPSLHQGWRYADAVLMAYRHADDLLGRVMDLIEPGTCLMVVSDHGFGPLNADVYLNRILLDLGSMAMDPSLLAEETARFLERQRPGLVGWAAGALASLILRNTPLGQRLTRPGRLPAEVLGFHTVDWSRTRAYSFGLFGSIFLNRMGREPLGIVQPQDAAAERQRLREAMMAYRLPDGLPLADKIYLAEEIYSGPELDRAPDLLLEMRDHTFLSRGRHEFASNSVVSAPLVNHTGNHRPEGVILAQGPGVAQGLSLPERSILDVAPTVLAMLGESVPADMDGHVIESLAPQPSVTPRGLSSPVRLRSERDQGENESDEVRRRLEALGYL